MRVKKGQKESEEEESIYEKERKKEIMTCVENS